MRPREQAQIRAPRGDDAVDMIGFVDVTHRECGNACFQTNALGEAYISPLDAIFDPYTVLQPDILFVSKERLTEVGRERIEGAPDLVVEVLSPSTFHKDLRRKMTVYSRFGVQEYWIVDPETQSMELYCLGKEGLQLERRFSAGEIFESRLLSGFRVEVSSIF